MLDWHARLRGHLPAPPNISIVAIDEKSLELVGRWPWPRTRTAEIIQRLAEGGAKVIVLDILMNEPDENSRLVLARTLAERYRALGFPRARARPPSSAGARGRPRGRRHRRGASPRRWPTTRRVVVPYFFVFEQR